MFISALFSHACSDSLPMSDLFAEDPHAGSEITWYDDRGRLGNPPSHSAVAQVKRPGFRDRDSLPYTDSIAAAMQGEGLLSISEPAPVIRTADWFISPDSVTVGKNINAVLQPTGDRAAPPLASL